MTVLPNYNEFAGRHWETGSVRNALAYQGVKAPHTGKPISEALLMGISGGAAFGYFTFEYEGYLPHIALLTRNTFDPMETLFERLALPREVLQTTNPQKGEENLREALESGRPALVWADMFTLPYYDLPYDERNWGMFPVLVFGIKNGTAYLADRSNSPIEVPVEVLQKARARVNKDKFRVMTLDAPDLSRLPTAVNKGIWQCISLFMEAPPKGARNNFGIAALKHWAEMLTNTRNKQSWARYFEPGERMWMALAGDSVQLGAFSFIRREAGNSAERGLYADFLDEAAVILEKPGLKNVATQFRQSEQLWHKLSDRLLPDDVVPFKEAKNLLTRKQSLFIDKGAEALPEIQDANKRLKAIQKDVAQKFPMSAAEVIIFRERLAEQVMKIHDAECEAVERLQAVMA